jgi:hypothetical protein
VRSVKGEGYEAVRCADFGEADLRHALVGVERVNVGTKAAEHQSEIMGERKRGKTGDNVDPARRGELVDCALEVIDREPHNCALQVTKIVGE